MKRRDFLAANAAGIAASAVNPSFARFTPIDFRYAPLSSQTAYCFPDDPYKSLVGNRGELRMGHPGSGKPLDYFTSIVEFSVAGMEGERIVKHALESPRSPIVRTVLERDTLSIELITFATNRPEEGRVDNVIVELRAKSKPLHAVPTVTITTEASLKTSAFEEGRTQVKKADGALFLVADSPLRGRDLGRATGLTGPARAVSTNQPVRLCFRFPQDGQPAERLAAGLAEPDALLKESRAFWNAWTPYGGKVQWKLAGRYQEFVEACARNIQQAREVKNGRKTFQVGPTVYRGLWIVDGNFLLEAARYLGYDEEAQQGLEATWANQLDDGGLVAAVKGPFWKDTGIAMFTMVRQAELSQDWSYFRRMTPNLLRAARFLEQARDQSIRDGGTNGKYRILAAGIGDGGLGGVKHELTNTIWALAGLRATVEAADKLGLSEFAPVKQFYGELQEACFAAAREEMRRHPKGFQYLPMLTRDDPGWNAPDEGDVSAAARKTIALIDPGIPVKVSSLEQFHSDAVALPRFRTLLLIVFAALAAALATAGVYGVMSYTAARRQAEMGVRIALGATAGDVVSILVGSGAKLAAIGLACGLAITLVAGRLIESLLYGIRPLDPLAIGAAVLLLSGAALVAALIPALRAARVDPALALRSE